MPLWDAAMSLDSIKFRDSLDLLSQRAPFSRQIIIFVHNEYRPAVDNEQCPTNALRRGKRGLHYREDCCIRKAPELIS
jgi:hypothetical protein